LTFQGDVAQIPISNIVQALFLNGQEGVLAVDSGTLRRDFRILKLGIRPLMTAADDLYLLRAALLKERILTEQQFDNAMSAWDPPTLFPGDFLLQRRVITPEQVEHCIRKQFEESIYEVLTAPDLRYEFSAGDHCLDQEVFDPDGLGSMLIYSVNGVLMEAVRREDEWRRIEEEVPTGYEIYVPVKKGLPSTVPTDIEIPGSVYKDMAKLLSGDCSVERIVAESVLSRYEVYHALFQLKTRGYIRRLRLAEKESLADKLRRLVKNREAVDVYRSILDEDSDNVRTRIQLIFLLEKSGNHPSLLIEHYLALVEQFETSESEKAKSYAEKILNLDPDNFEAHEKLFVIHALVDDRSGALAAIRALLNSVRKTGAYEEGAEVLMRVLNYYPEETPLYHELADLLMASNQNDLAVDCLKSVADLYERAGDTQRQLKTYELIVRVDPTANGTLKRIAGESKRASVRTSDLLKISSIATIVGVILVALAYLGFIEIDSRRVYAESEKATRTQMRYHRYDRARKTVQDFLSAYSFSSRKQVATDLITRIRQEEKGHQSKVANTRNEFVRILGTTLHKAERAVKLGNHQEAREELTRGVREAAAYEGQMNEEFIKKYDRMKALLQKVDDYLGGAGRLVAQITKARKLNKLGEAHKYSLELLRHYPRSAESDALRIGVRVESTPSGATLIFGQQRFGKTPLVVDLPPRRMINGILELPSFRRTPIQIRPSREYEVHFGMEKTPAWVFDSGGPIDSVPAAADSLIFFGNRNGRMFCLNQDGRKKWNEFKVPLDISGGLAFWNNIACFGSFDGNFYMLNAATGTPRGAPVKATRAGNAIKLAPSAPSEKGIIVFNAGNRFLVGVDMTTNRKKWEYAAPGSLSGPPQLDGKSLYCFMDPGHLLELDLHTSLPKGKLTRRLKFGGTLTHPGRIVDSIAYLSFAGGEVRALDVRSEKQLWSKTLDSAPTAPPTVAVEAGVVILPLASGELVCLETKTGDLRWKRETEIEALRLTTSGEKIQLGTINTAGACDGTHYYVGTREGYVLCWRIDNGQLEWMYRTMGATQTPRKGIATQGLLRPGLFVQGSDDGHLYGFAIESR
jgi:outer membrane protein assembly factor BamB/tetratricopeptide (TPR) repeat protein